jgi:cobalt/nickel transport system permease protein
MTLAFQTLPAPDSALRRLDPRWKLAGLVLLLFVVAFLRGPAPTLLALAAGVLLVIIGRLPPRWYLSRMGWLVLVLSPFLLCLPLLMPLDEALLLGVVLAARAVTVVSLVLVLLTSASLNDLLKAAHALRVPGLLVQLFALTYRYVFLIAGELTRIRIALRARGYRNRATRHSYRTVGHVTGTLLVRSHERGERVAQAMRCRGFDGQYRSLSTFRTRAADVLFFLTLTAGSAGLLTWDLVGRGVL